MPPVGGDPLGVLDRSVGALRATAGTVAFGLLDRITTALSTADTAGDPELPVPVAGSRTLPVPLRIAIALDESGSTSSTDPNRESHRACLLVCDWLATHSQRSDDRIGLVRFADRTDTLAPIRAAKAGKSFAEMLQSGRDIGGGTRLTPAVDELCRLLSGRRRDRRLALLITDGQVAESDAELRAVIGRLRAQADAVYVLAPDYDSEWSQHTHTRYGGLGLTGQIPIGQLTGGRLAHAIATLLVHEAGLDTTETPRRR